MFTCFVFPFRYSSLSQKDNIYIDVNVSQWQSKKLSKKLTSSGDWTSGAAPADLKAVNIVTDSFPI